MKVRRFVAPNSRQALARVKDALGEDAIILANREVPDGVEILACHEEDFGDGLGEAELLATAATPDAATLPTQRPRPSIAAPLPSSMDGLMEEVRALRIALERKQEMSDVLPALGVGDLRWLESLRDIGFSRGLARHLAERVPQVQSPQEMLAWVEGALLKSIRTLSDDEGPFLSGGVFALVGPTGVGKTTTTAKLAAKIVLSRGASQLAMISTDGYRIGAQEQLRTYARILRVPVFAARDEEDLNHALAAVSDRDTVLIDTVGMSQRDQMLAEQVAVLGRTSRPVKRLLCLNASSSLETLDEVVRAYSSSGLAGVIVTKVDEATRLGHVVDVLLRHKLSAWFLTTGQRVPEDFEVATPEGLLARSLDLGERAAIRAFEAVAA